MNVDALIPAASIIKIFAVLFSIAYIIYTLFFLQQVLAIMKVLKDGHNSIFLVVTYLQILLGFLLLLLALVII